MKKAIRGLYAVTPELADTEMLSHKTEAAVRGGARIVQYRNKTATADLRRLQLRAIASICRRTGAILIVNDSAELAGEFQADGVHLGREDGAVAAARALLGPDRWIGVSCYNDLQRARDAIVSGADYLAFGSFFSSPTKPGAVRAARDMLRAARDEFALPIVAIGGINAGNAGVLIEDGADAVAVVSALFDAPDIEREARRIAGLFTDSESET